MICSPIEILQVHLLKKAFDVVDYDVFLNINLTAWKLNLSLFKALQERSTLNCLPLNVHIIDNGRFSIKQVAYANFIGVILDSGI